jgi:hypothetical protein
MQIHCLQKTNLDIWQLWCAQRQLHHAQSQSSHENSTNNNNMAYNVVDVYYRLLRQRNHMTRTTTTTTKRPMTTTTTMITTMTTKRFGMGGDELNGPKRCCHYEIQLEWIGVQWSPVESIRSPLESTGLHWFTLLT